MANITEWIQNPNRNYQEGLEIYKKYKINNKYDNFLFVQTPSSMQQNMLLTQLLKILQRRPDLANVETVPEPIKIRKISSKKTTTDSASKTESGAQKTVQQMRADKELVNNLLRKSFKELTYQEALVFNNSESYFTKKKVMMLDNGNINQEMRSLHAKVKAIDPDPKNNQARSEIMEKLVELEKAKTANWTAIDQWEEPVVTSSTGDTAKAVQDAIARDKKIKANRIYIYRGLNQVKNMPSGTEKEKEKIAEKMAKIDERRKELEEMGVPYDK